MFFKIIVLVMGIFGILGGACLGGSSNDESSNDGDTNESVVYEDPPASFRNSNYEFPCTYDNPYLDNRMAIDGETLYAVESGRGLFVYDLSDPTQITQVGFLEISGFLSQLSVHNGVVVLSHTERAHLPWQEGVEFYINPTRSRALVLDAQDPSYIIELVSKELSGDILKTGFVGEVAVAMAWRGRGAIPEWTTELVSFTPNGNGGYDHVQTVIQEELFWFPIHTSSICEDPPIIELLGNHFVATLHDRGDDYRLALYDAMVDSSTGEIHEFTGKYAYNLGHNIIDLLVGGDSFLVWHNSSSNISIYPYYAPENSSIETAGGVIFFEEFEEYVKLRVMLEDLVVFLSSSYVAWGDFKGPVSKMVLPKPELLKDVMQMTAVGNRLLMISPTHAMVFDATTIRDGSFIPSLQIEYMPGFTFSPSTPLVNGNRVFIRGIIEGMEELTNERTVVLTLDATQLLAESILQGNGDLVSNNEHLIQRMDNMLKVTTFGPSIGEHTTSSLEMYRDVSAVSRPFGDHQAMLVNTPGENKCTLTIVAKGEFGAIATGELILPNGNGEVKTGWGLHCISNQCFAGCGSSLTQVDVSVPSAPVLGPSYVLAPPEWQLLPGDSYLVALKQANEEIGMDGKVFKVDGEEYLDFAVLPGAEPELGKIVSVFLQSDLLVVSRSKLVLDDEYARKISNTAQVFDLTDPLQPSLVSQFSIPGRVVHVGEKGDTITVFGYQEKTIEYESGGSCGLAGGLSYRDMCLVAKVSQLNIETGNNIVVTIPQMGGWVAALAVSGDVLFAVVVDGIMEGFSLRLWDLTTGEEGAEIPIPISGLLTDTGVINSFEMVKGPRGHALLMYKPANVLYSIDSTNIHAPIVTEQIGLYNLTADPVEVQNPWTSITSTDTTTYFSLGLEGVVSIPW
jgi:hypothetical protein